MTTVAVLTPDVSENCLGRAHVLARLLQPRFGVRIVGPQYGRGVWEPLADDETVPVVGVPMPRTGLGEGREGWKRVVAELDADAVYVSKPFATSLRAAREAVGPERVLLDIDDWEPGILADQQARSGLLRRLRTGRFTSLHHRQPWNVRSGDREARTVPHRTVSNRFLQQRYGGTLLWHARDTDAFDPAKVDPAAERERLGLDPDAPVVMFLGTPRGHKGLEDLAQAVAALPDPRTRLVVVGADPSPRGKPLVEGLLRLCPGRLVLRPPQPFAAAPRTLAAADVVAIPSRPTAASQGQMPAKVFDAMAMAKPVVATAVSDLPEVLEGCGRTVPGADPDALAEALEELLADPALRRHLGRAAREKCVERYSYHAMRPVAQTFVQEALA